MRYTRDNHFRPCLLWGNLCSALFIFLVLMGTPPPLSSRSDSSAMTGLIIAQTKDTLAIRRDEQAGDRIIMVFPPTPGSEGSGITIGRDQVTGDRIIHVVPPPAAVAQEKGQDIFIGPLFIMPEITWPPDPRR